MARRPRQPKQELNWIPVRLPDGSHAMVQSGMPKPRLSQDAGRGLAQDDSGSIERFAMARHQKPEKLGFFRSLLRKWMGTEPEAPPSAETTEIGSAGAASPTTFELSLYSLRYERRAKIADCRQMIMDDPRARRSSKKFAREAARKGCQILPSKKVKDAKILDVLKNVEEIVNKESKLFSWAWMLPVEGEIFVQSVIEGDELVDAKRMPASSMERNTDDNDNFINPLEAFSQVDVVTNQDIAQFPLGLIKHVRWDWLDGERYGESELVAGRRLRRLLELEEEALAVHRMSRASMTRLWNIGTPDNPGREKDVLDFKNNNGFIEGKREVFNPMEAARDYFGNGIVSVNPVVGDGNVEAVGDLRYTQNVLTSSAYPTPAFLYGLDAESINRDVMDDLRTEYLKEVHCLRDCLTEIVKHLVSLALLLKGVLPETVTYTVKMVDTSINKPAEVVTNTVTLRQNVTGGGQPDPLISRRTAVGAIAEYYDLDDVDEELKQIEKEMEEDMDKAQERQMTMQEASLQMQQKYMPQEPGKGGISQPGANTSPLRAGAQAGRGNGANGNGKSSSRDSAIDNATDNLLRNGALLRNNGHNRFNTASDWLDTFVGAIEGDEE